MLDWQNRTVQIVILLICSQGCILLLLLSACLSDIVSCSDCVMLDRWLIDICRRRTAPPPYQSLHAQANRLVAQRYNDQSVLENMHIALTFELLKKDELNVLNTVDATDTLAVSKFVCVVVCLSTHCSLLFLLSSLIRQEHSLITYPVEYSEARVVTHKGNLIRSDQSNSNPCTWIAAVDDSHTELHRIEQQKWIFDIGTILFWILRIDRLSIDCSFVVQ